MEETSALAIIHAHPPHAITLSLLQTETVPNDAEGLAIIGRVPVLGCDTEVKPGCLVPLAGMLAQALKKHRIVMVRGHGAFAIGQLLEEAHNCTTALEESCQVICLLNSLKEAPARK